VTELAIVVVVIGRNEGDRLVGCLDSLAGRARAVVYVDSASTDDSLANARRAGTEALSLDMSRPFTAGRARNLGLSWVRAMNPPPQYVQVVDGDCIVQPGWLDTAFAFLESHPDAGVVCGRTRERFPEASIYNLLCDWEWNTPVGEALSCGGSALIRMEALNQSGLYNEGVIAAEDDELCVRVRKTGWKIWRIDADMTLHDASILRFGQWWRRMVRAGHGFAQVGTLHPGHFIVQRRRIWIWGILLPVIATVGAFTWPAITAAAFGLYLLSWLKGIWTFTRLGFRPPKAISGSTLLLLAKFNGLQGYLTYWLRRLKRSDLTIIEYK